MRRSRLATLDDILVYSHKNKWTWEFALREIESEGGMRWRNNGSTKGKKKRSQTYS